MDIAERNAEKETAAQYYYFGIYRMAPKNASWAELIFNI